MDEFITWLLDEGYELYFTKNDAGYEACVSGPGRGNCTCGHDYHMHSIAHVDPARRCVAGSCGCEGYARGDMSCYEDEVVAASPMQALVSAMPKAISYEVCMMPKGKHPYPDARAEAGHRLDDLEEHAGDLDERITALEGHASVNVDTIKDDLEFISGMTPDEMRMALAWLSGFAPEVFGKTAAHARRLRNRESAERAGTRLLAELRVRQGIDA